jgi:hypothetical protein
MQSEKDKYQKRKKPHGAKYLNSRKLYEPFRNGDMVTLRDRLSGKSVQKSVAGA